MLPRYEGKECVYFIIFIMRKYPKCQKKRCRTSPEGPFKMKTKDIHWRCITEFPLPPNWTTFIMLNIITKYIHHWDHPDSLGMTHSLSLSLSVTMLSTLLLPFNYAYWSQQVHAPSEVCYVGNKKLLAEVEIDERGSREGTIRERTGILNASLVSNFSNAHLIYITAKYSRSRWHLL